METVEAVGIISNFSIPFSGSIVAMPHVVGEADIEDTIRFLSNAGAETIRVFMPGYTKYSNLPNPPYDMRKTLKELVSRIRRCIDTPILLEPALLKELTPVVEGVVSGSPAHRSGIRGGDIILRINGKSVFSRVDAFYRAFYAKNPEIEYMSDNEIKKTIFEKASRTRSGLVVNYDMDAESLDAIMAAIQRNRDKGCLLLTSEFAYDIMVRCLKDEAIDIKAAQNAFFGGNIGCCGLLVLDDIKLKLSEIKHRYEVVFLPSIMFDNHGRDLMGKHYKDLEHELGIRIEVI